jgi:hypothetical protein
MDIPQSLQDLDLPSLIGRPVAEARHSVEGAGGVARLVAPGGVVTADYRSNRVTLIVDGDWVVGTTGIG